LESLSYARKGLTIGREEEFSGQARTSDADRRLHEIMEECYVPKEFQDNQCFNDPEAGTTKCFFIYGCRK